MQAAQSNSENASAIACRTSMSMPPMALAAVARLAHATASSSLRACYGAWAGLAESRLREAQVEAKRRERSRYERALAGWVKTHDGVFKASCFTSWREFAEKSRQARLQKAEERNRLSA